jgi:hypothetical protein
MRSKKREPSREEVDDQKFLNAMEGERFRARIERKANMAILCPHCGGCDWKMKPKYVVNWVRNDLIATMVCRECKRAVLFASQIEPDYPEEEQEELDEFTDQLYSQLEITDVHPFVEDALKSRLRRRIARLDADERIRLLMYLR